MKRRSDEWAVALPLTHGWYWWRKDSDTPARCVWVGYADGEKATCSFVAHNSPKFFTADMEHGEWFGPLEVPK